MSERTNPQNQPKSPPSCPTVFQLLLQNSEILAQLSMQSKIRRNKNLLNARMSILIHRLERNLIRIAKKSTPQAIGDPKHIEIQKNRFINFYKQRNNNKK